MTLEEAIKHCHEKSCNTKCGREHKQLAQWLEELLEFRKTVQYGKWKRECYMGDCEYYCSLCGEHALYEENSFSNVLSKYCPNCGHKMR